MEEGENVPADSDAMAVKSKIDKEDKIIDKEDKIIDKEDKKKEDEKQNKYRTN